VFLNLDVRLEEVSEGLDVASTLEWLAALVSLGEQLDGREAANTELGRDCLVLGGIEFRDDGARVGLGEFFPRRLHANAVAAPWCVELDKDILRWVKDDAVEVVRSQGDDVCGNEERCEECGEREDDGLHHF